MRLNVEEVVGVALALDLDSSVGKPEQIPNEYLALRAVLGIRCPSAAHNPPSYLVPQGVQPGRAVLANNSILVLSG